MSFYNTNIFPADGDYIIAGMPSHKKDAITYTDIYFGTIDRIEKMVRQYCEESVAAENKFKKEHVTEEDAYGNIRQMLYDSLKIDTYAASPQSIAEAIMNGDQMKKWLSGIEDNFKQQTTKVAYAGIISSNTSSQTDNEDFERATACAEEASLEQLIEQLSMIEL